MQRVDHSKIGRSLCRLVGLVAACGFAASADAQVFQRAYGTQQAEVQLDIVDTHECGYASVGFRTIAVTGGAFNTTHALKYDRDGALIWSYVYNTSQGQTVGYTIDESRSKDFLIGAESAFGGNNLGKWLVRVDTNGVPQWSRLMAGTPFLASIAPTQPSLGVSARELSTKDIASVNRRQVGAGFGRHGLLHINSPAGALVTGRVYVPTGVDIAELDFAEVREAKDALLPVGPNFPPDLFIVGNTFDESAGRYAAVVMRVTNSGTVIWARKYIHPDPGVSITADGFAVDPLGNVTFAGRRGPAVRGQLSPKETIVARVDGVTGAFDWATAIDDFSAGYQAVEYVRNREIMVAGTVTSGAAAPVRAASIIKLGFATGAFVDAQLYGGLAAGDDERGHDAIESQPWGGYALIGQTNNGGLGAPDLYFVKPFTTLESGCLERKFDPTIKRPELLVKDLPLVTTFEQAAEPVSVINNFLELGQKVFCFKKPCLGDLNGDGLVDDTDFTIFVVAYDFLLCPTNPAFTCCPADLNGDGQVDDLDFSIFVVNYDDLICP
ncbi:MAG: hypothetical protein K2Y21_11670 [Phycisphaerales bacterium]|nr:hypothetical protein [Phycisphaerales bacterium]